MIGRTRFTIPLVQWKIRKGQLRANTGYCAAAVGSSARGAAVPRAVAGSARTSALSASASVSVAPQGSANEERSKRRAAVQGGRPYQHEFVRERVGGKFAIIFTTQTNAFNVKG